MSKSRIIKVEFKEEFPGEWDERARRRLPQQPRFRLFLEMDLNAADAERIREFIRQYEGDGGERLGLPDVALEPEQDPAERTLYGDGPGKPTG